MAPGLQGKGCGASTDVIPGVAGSGFLQLLPLAQHVFAVGLGFHLGDDSPNHGQGLALVSEGTHGAPTNVSQMKYSSVGSAAHGSHES